MKIWKAELILHYTEKENYETVFIFEQQRKDYEINEKFREWLCRDGWLSSSLPMDLTIDKTLMGEFKIVQGFEYELSEKELLKLEKDMKRFMKNQLVLEKKNYLKKFEEKIQVLL